MTLCPHPQTPSAPVHPSVAASRHPDQWAKLLAKLGASPTSVQYECQLCKHPQPLDYQQAPDPRVVYAADQVPLMTRLDLVGRTAAGKKVKVAIPVGQLAAASWPLELWGPDPKDREGWPSLWLLDVNGDHRFLGWTQWRLAGLARRRRTTPLYQMPWFAVVFRGRHQYALHEGVSDPNALFTLREHLDILSDADQRGLSYPPEIAQRIRFYPSVSGLGLWDPVSNRPGGLLSAADQAKWEFIENGDPLIDDWVARHCTQIDSRLYPKTQQFYQPLASARYLDERSCSDASVEAIFAWQRGEVSFSAVGGYTDPIRALRAGVDILPGFY